MPPHHEPSHCLFGEGHSQEIRNLNVFHADFARSRRILASHPDHLESCSCAFAARLELQLRSHGQGQAGSQLGSVLAHGDDLRLLTERTPARKSARNHDRDTHLNAHASSQGSRTRRTHRIPPDWKGPAAPLPENIRKDARSAHRAALEPHHPYAGSAERPPRIPYAARNAHPCGSPEIGKAWRAGANLPPRSRRSRCSKRGRDRSLRH